MAPEPVPMDRVQCHRPRRVHDIRGAIREGRSISTYQTPLTDLSLRPPSLLSAYTPHTLRTPLYFTWSFPMRGGGGGGGAFVNSILVQAGQGWNLGMPGGGQGEGGWDSVSRSTPPPFPKQEKNPREPALQTICSGEVKFAPPATNVNWSKGGGGRGVEGAEKREREVEMANCNLPFDLHLLVFYLPDLPPSPGSLGHVLVLL